MSELYSEVLYQILHTVGCDVSTKENRDVLVQYLQEAFKIDSDDHAVLLEDIKSRTAPNVLLNVEVIEAKDLVSTDPNGLSDPFCTVYLNSASAQCQTTSIKNETLQPVWKECFQLPTTDLENDILYVEVWDFDAEESTREKLKKLKEIKGMRGIRNFLHEVRSSGRNNDLVGSAHVSLNNIPATGKTVWCTLEKNGKLKKQGEVKLNLSFALTKNPADAFKEHRHLLHGILTHELQLLKVKSEEWSGKFSPTAETVLTHHRVQCGLAPLSVTLAKWIEMSNVHIHHPIKFAIFLPMLQQLVAALQENLLADDEIAAFWDAAKKLVSSCMISIKKLQIETSFNKTSDQSSDILSILSMMATVKLPQDVVLFPFTVYDWLSIKEDNHDISSAVKETVLQGSQDWFHCALEKFNVTSAEEEERLNNLISIVEHAILNLKKALTYHDKLFQEHFHFPYTKEIYNIFQEKISQLVEPIVISETKCMKKLIFSEDTTDGAFEHDTLKAGAALFQLYLSLQQFAGFEDSLFPDGEKISFSKVYYHWFYPTALHWLYISYYKSLQGINKAVNLDHFVPVDNSVEYSSSAVDTLHIFEQIRIFWMRLAWPDDEAAFTFATNIINDIGECCTFYADKVNEKVEQMCEHGDSEQRKFQVTEEWCVAMKNIVHIQQSIKTLLAEFGLEDIISSFAGSEKKSSVETCKLTIQTMIESQVNEVDRKIHDMMDRAAIKMSANVSRVITEINIGRTDLDPLMKYLDECLSLLHSNIESKHFRHFLVTLWTNILNVLDVNMDSNIRVNRDPSFFKRQHEAFKTLLEFFQVGIKDILNINSALLKKVEKGLKLYAMETSELIHQYYLERREEQKLLDPAVYGLITVRLQLVENILTIEVLNARNLCPLKNKHHCNPYVRICLLPEEKFANVSKMATKVHKKVLFPLFEEVFTVELSPEQQRINNGLVMFVVKEKNLLIEDKVIAEAFASFADITKTDATVKLQSVEQLHLKLNRPNSSDSESFQVLCKQDNKLAQDFIKKRRHMFRSDEHSNRKETKN